jgi:hypothetical protein
VFLSYSPCHKGVKFLEVFTGRVYISRDVVFDGTLFPFKPLHPNDGALLRKKIFSLILLFANLSRGTVLLMILLWKILMLLTHLLVLFLMIFKVQLIETHQHAKILVKTVPGAVHLTLLSIQEKTTPALNPRQIL